MRGSSAISPREVIGLAKKFYPSSAAFLAAKCMAAVTPRTTGLRYLDYERLLPNPYNPRRLFDRIPLKVLKDSVREVGILVPLLVYEKEDSQKYVILDGERRWRCVRELIAEHPSTADKWRKVPVNIVDEPSMVSNILMMFNIHNIREPWELMPTALKLEILMKELKETDNDRLSELTGLSLTQVRRCKILLDYDSKYQELMMAEDPSRRAKSDFFIELYPVLNLIERNLPEVNGRFTRNEIIDRLLGKFEKGIIKNVVDFRHVADVIRAARKGDITREQALEVILDLLEQPKKGISDFLVRQIRLPRELDELESAVNSVERLLSGLVIVTQIEKDRLQSIANRLRDMLSHIDQLMGKLD